MAGRIRARALELGFALCGVCEAAGSHRESFFLEWLAAGRHGEMDYLARNIQERMNPSVLLPGARSIICVADRVPFEAVPKSVAGAGRIAAYARLTDYHNVIKKRLFTIADELRAIAPAQKFRVCVDTAPINEREQAVRAGLGWIGKNTLLIHPKLGSQLLLGVIVTTMELAADEAMADHCGSCTRCIDACPTGCISPYSLDASRCISYLTIEHRGATDGSLDVAAGDWIYGCDICQDVCPYNSNSKAPPARAEPWYEQREGYLDLLEVLNWTPEQRREAFTRSPMKRAKLAQMRRNAAIAAANAILGGGDPEGSLRRRLGEIAGDELEDDLVRRAARRGIARLISSDGDRN